MWKRVTKSDTGYTLLRLSTTRSLPMIHTHFKTGLKRKITNDNLMLLDQGIDWSLDNKSSSFLLYLGTKVFRGVYLLSSFFQRSYWCWSNWRCINYFNNYRKIFKATLLCHAHKPLVLNKRVLKILVMLHIWDSVRWVLDNGPKNREYYLEWIFANSKRNLCIWKHKESEKEIDCTRY